MNKRILFNVILFFNLSFCMIPDASCQTVMGNTVIVPDKEKPDSLEILPKGKKKDSYWNRLFNGNIDRTHERKIDLSFVAAPSYTREASFGVGGIASGLYRLDRSDSIMQPSNISLSGNASVSGFYSINIFGNNYFKGNRSRLSYDAAFTTKPLDFWGINYDACAVNPIINYTRRQIQIDADYVYQVKDNFFVGTALRFTDARITEIDDLSYLEGDKRFYTFTGLGISMQYDSRDFIPNPRRGIYLMMREIFFPQMLSSHNKTVYRTTFIADFYQKAGQGSVLAVDLYGQFNSNDSPWTIKEELGGGYRMRGYYIGRYIDNNIMSAQLELRQHLVDRFGCVVWGGAGTVFPALNQVRWSDILPTYGLGLRWEFKHNVNIRIDYGFGKQTGGFVFNLNEAF